MRKLAAALFFAAAPLVIAPLMPMSVAVAATLSELGDLSPLSAIATDTLTITRSGDLAGAQKRITDFETAWDDAAGTMQPLSPAKWEAIDVAADRAIGALRVSTPIQAEAELALTGLIAQLDNPGGGAPVPAAAVVADGSAGLVVTNADGSPLPCEVALKTLRDSAAGKSPSDKGKYDQLLNKGLDRCNADDDKRADGFFADAFALLQ